MLDVKQLRIGNYIALTAKSGSNRTGTVSKLEEFDGRIEMIYDDLVYPQTENHTDDMQPIGINAYWLRRLGFVEKEGEMFVKPMGEGFEFRIIPGPWKYEIFELNSERSYKGWSDHLKYVHEVQNLYFALTGTE